MGFDESFSCLAIHSSPDTYSPHVQIQMQKGFPSFGDHSIYLYHADSPVYIPVKHFVGSHDSQQKVTTLMTNKNISGFL